jgi:hypothetical protein
MPTVEKVNLSQKLDQIPDQWKPRIVGELNGQHVKLVRFQGEFVWHHHEHEDELFLVVKGRFRMGLSIGRWPRKRPRSCCSSRPRRSIRATSGTSGRSTRSSGSEPPSRAIASIIARRRARALAREAIVSRRETTRTAARSFSGRSAPSNAS